MPPSETQPETKESPLSIDLRPLAGHPLDIDQYFGLWAIEDARFLQMLDRIGHMDLRTHVELHAGDSSISAAVVRQEQIDQGTTIAVIDIQGTLTKRGSSLSNAGSLVRLRQTVRAAARDPEIGGILLRIDSPGGTVAGTADLAHEVAAAAAKKPVYAFAEDLTASAAYWVASQASKVFANNATAMIGSIGTFVGLYDYSGYAAKEGIKAVVIKAGKYKGTGFPGTEITDEQRDYWQQIIDKTQQEFSAGVSAGRKLSAARVEELADGRVHTAADAKTLGLIDGIQSFDQTLSDLVQQVRSNSSSKTNRKSTMSEDKNTQAAPPALPDATQAATYRELKDALNGADAEFLTSQLDAAATLPQAQSAWMAEQNRRIEEANKATEDAKAQAETNKMGVDPLGGGNGKANSSAGGDPIVAYREALSAKTTAGMSRQEAVLTLEAEQPELHQDYVEAINDSLQKKT